jgi:hypothetical protein
MTQLLLLLIVGGAFIAYSIWMKKKTGAMQDLMPAAYRMLFERTGYRVAALGPAPIEAHVAQVVKNYAAIAGAGEHREAWLRDFHGVQIQYDSYMGTNESGARVMSARWSTINQTPPRVQWEVAEKSLVGVRKAIGEVLSKMTRGWAPSLPNQFQSGDPEMDARFFFYASDPNAAMAIVRDPSIRGHLLASAEVCFCVHAGEIFFSDPMQKNVNAGIGGTVGQMAIGLDIMKRTELMIPVHDRMAELIAVAQRNSR